MTYFLYAFTNYICVFGNLKKICICRVYYLMENKYVAAKYASVCLNVILFIEQRSKKFKVKKLNVLDWPIQIPVEFVHLTLMLFRKGMNPLLPSLS